MFTLRRLMIGLMLLAAGTAEAVQLGQLTVGSRHGESLAARIELYGATAQTATAYQYELRPDIGTRNSAAVTDFVATTAHDARGNPYISVKSTNPITTSPIAFRLRMTGPTGSLVQHYSFALSAPPVAVAPVAARSVKRSTRAVARKAAQTIVAAPVQASSTSQLYGPVRPGLSLWRILQDNGLATGDFASTIARIVAANPQAFVAGDANRLVAGAMLDLGGAVTVSTVAANITGVAAEATAKATTPKPSAPSTPREIATPTKAATAARLAALEKKFAAIRARYAAQESVQPLTVAMGTTTETVASEVPPVASPERDTTNSNLPTSSVATTSISKTLPASVRPVETSPQPIAEASITANLPGFALPAGGALAGMLMLGTTLRMTRRKRRLQHVAAHHDQELERVAQISAKAEKRLQLEDEVKRRFTNNKLQLAKKPIPTVERSLESQLSMTHGFEEIETRIAYGHYDQAAGLLAEVLDKSPGNHRAKLRLAEVYYLSGQSEAFVALAVDIQTEHRAEIDDDEWGRIVRMGKIIAPESAPFRGPTVIESLQRVG